MRDQSTLWPLIVFTVSLLLGNACTLSNQVEDIKVLCSLNDVNHQLDYVRLLTPSLAPLSEQERGALSAEFIHSDGRTEKLSATAGGCLALPRAEGSLSVRVSTDREFVAFDKDLKSDRPMGQRDLLLSERGHLNVGMTCPEQGFLGNRDLAPLLDIKDGSDNLQNLELSLTVKDSAGKDLGTLFTKEFGAKDLRLPTRLSLTSLAEGQYALHLTLRDSFYGASPKALLSSSRCSLVVKRSCPSPNDTFDPDEISCKPKLCDNKYRVGEFWSEALSNKKGNGLFTCTLKNGEPVKFASDATCDAGYFESRASCLGARQVAAGLNHSCAVLENGDVSCWGHNVFDTLGLSASSGSSGQVLGPQAPVALSEAARSVAVSSVSSCALLQSGRVQCWGYLPENLNADGFVQHKATHQPLFVHLADGSELQNAETLVVGGGPDHDTYCVVTKEKSGLCWGKDLFSHSQTLQFGNWLYPQRVFADHMIQQLVVTDREICALDTAGSVTCQGSGLGTDLASITPQTISTPIPVSLPAPARALFSQSVGKCALLIDDRLYCWGLKTDRSQNLEWVFNHGVPDIPRMLMLPEEKKEFFGQVKDVGLNGEISCVLKSDLQPVCQLGPNDYGMEWIDGKSISTRPTGLHVKDILGPDDKVLRGMLSMSVGFWHGCGVHQSGQVYCWGNNQFGRLGNGTIGESGTGNGIPHSIHASLVRSM